MSYPHQSTPKYLTGLLPVETVCTCDLQSFILPSASGWRTLGKFFKIHALTHICLGKAGSIIHPVRAGFAVFLPLLKTENSVLLDGTRALQSEGETVLSRQRVIAIDTVKKETAHHGQKPPPGGVEARQPGQL